MTTLELAHRIAHAVCMATHRPCGFACDNLAEDPGTQAVLRTLHDTGHWFCVRSEGPQGETVETAMEYVQPDLFCSQR